MLHLQNQGGRRSTAAYPGGAAAICTGVHPARNRTGAFSWTGVRTEVAASPSSPQVRNVWGLGCFAGRGILSAAGVLAPVMAFFSEECQSGGFSPGKRPPASRRQRHPEIYIEVRKERVEKRGTVTVTQALRHWLYRTRGRGKGRSRQAYCDVHSYHHGSCQYASWPGIPSTLHRTSGISAGAAPQGKGVRTRSPGPGIAGSAIGWRWS